MHHGKGLSLVPFISLIHLPTDVFPTPLQKGDLDNKHRGKFLKYSEHLLAANPSRPFVLCVLTNTEDLEVYKVTKSMEGQNQVERSSMVNMSGAPLLPRLELINGARPPRPPACHQCGPLSFLSPFKPYFHRTGLGLP